ncbi:hypothetical protein RRG08_018526 [Elysia crispata]|uniref:TFIID subunit TAF5 NTD2 domain-containing protein n=1 Tax=Elysia crispata TaxID=231223 RepID=A0AAE0YDR9_9GAST|nr:hypothetical protein RRG08_018526 [Elysia crispata]
MGPFQAIIASSIARFVPEWKCSYQQRATPQRLNCEKLDPMVVAYHCLSELVRICPFPSLTWRQLACIAQLWSIRTSRICPMPFMRWRQVYSSGTEGIYPTSHSEMKRSKNDHIRSTISRYFKRRQFTEIEMSSRKDARQKHTITDLSVRRQTRSRASVDNTLAMSSISGDATAFDQQFTRLKTFISTAVMPYRSQLETILFPMFASVYLEMLCNGQKVPAHKFHGRHCEAFPEEHRQPFLKLLKKLETKSEVLTNKTVAEFRDNRTILKADQDTVDYLMRFLTTEENMIILQVFNQYIQTDVTGALPNGTIELSSMPEVKEEAHSDTSSLQVNQNGDDKSVTPVLEEELTSVIQAVRDLPPSLPSICFFTFLNTYQGLCSATLSQDKKRLSGCFEDASISVWNLEPDIFTRCNVECDPSKVVLAADFIHCTQDEIREKMNCKAIQSSERANLMGHRGAVYKTRFLHNSHSHLLSCSEDCTALFSWKLFRFIAPLLASPSCLLDLALKYHPCICASPVHLDNCPYITSDLHYFPVVRRFS